MKYKILLFFFFINISVTFSQELYQRSKINQVVKNAKQYLGTPYKFGGSSKYGLDCSGLVQIAFKNAGIDIPRSSRAQASYSKGEFVKKSDLRKGDLVFFKMRNRISHVALVISNTDNIIKIIHSSTKRGGGVKIQKLADIEHFYHKGKRLFY